MGGASDWLKLYRRLATWRWAKHPATLAVWVHILLAADRDYGDWLTGIAALAARAGLTERQTRRALANLMKTQEIICRKEGRAVRIIVNKWCLYQAQGVKNGPDWGANGSQRGHDWPIPKLLAKK